MAAKKKDSKKHALHIGLNHVDPKHYDGWDGELSGCHNDAKAMHAITQPGFTKTAILLDAQATANAVMNALTKAASELDRGDLLVVTYSGHGGQVPDTNGDERENGVTDGKDETWCLWDREFVDDELAHCWSQFKKGVRIFVLSDSCHSGTILRASRARMAGEQEDVPVTPVRHRAMPEEVKRAVYESHRKLYNGIQDKYPEGEKVPIEASVLLISGCQDNQESSDGAANGLFTETLLRVWNYGAFKGGYKAFHRGIAKLMPPWQSPNYFWAGQRDGGFERQRPFGAT